MCDVGNFIGIFGAEEVQGKEEGYTVFPWRQFSVIALALLLWKSFSSIFYCFGVALITLMWVLIKPAVVYI